MKRRFLLAALACLATAARTQSLAVMPPAPTGGVRQRLGARLPLDLLLTDSRGSAVRLGDYFGDGRAVLLVPGYYTCPQLCGLQMQALLQGLRDASVPRDRWRIVRVSFDAQDTSRSARARESADRAFADFIAAPAGDTIPLDMQLLTGPEAVTSSLMRTIGLDYAVAQADGDAASRAARYSHGSAVIVVTPQGQVSRYLLGLDYPPSELRSALREAAGGGLGNLSDRIALLCAHIDPALGRHSLAVMNGLRAGALLLAGALGTWCWRRRNASPEGPSR